MLLLPKLKAKLLSAISASVVLISRRPLLVLLAALVLTGASINLIPKLSIKSDLADLLPPAHPSVCRLREIEKRLGTQSDMIVTVESPSFEQNVAFGEALAQKIRTLKDQVGLVQFRRDRRYFEDHALLYLELGELEKLRNRVRQRIQEAVSRSMDAAMGIDEDEDAGAGGSRTDDDFPVDEFDRREADDDLPVDEFDRKEAGAAASRGGGGGSRAAEEEPDSLGGKDDQDHMEQLRQRFREYDIDEYMRTPDGTLVILKVRPFFPPTKLEKARKLEEAIRRFVDELQPATFHPELKVSFKGDYAEKQSEVSGIRSDIFSSSLYCLLALMAVIGLQFRTVRAIPLILLPTVIAILCTLGFAQLTIGHLNIVSSFIFAILVGMGVDYSIHAMARYDEERRRGKDVVEAITTALQHTGMSNVTAALTTVAVFLVLLLADFRGFSEFGFIAAVGILLSIACMFVVFPAVVFLAERLRRGRYAAPHAPSTSWEQRRARWSRWKPAPWMAVVVLVASVAAAGFSAYHVGDIGFEYSFSKLSRKVRQATPAQGGPAQAPAAPAAAPAAPAAAPAAPAAAPAAAAATAEQPAKAAAAPAPATAGIDSVPAAAGDVGAGSGGASAGAGSGSAGAGAAGNSGSGTGGGTGQTAAEGVKEEDRYLEAAGKSSDVAPAVVLTENLDETRLVYDTFQAILALPEEDVDHPERWTSPLLRPIRERYPDPVEWMRFARTRIYKDVISIWKYVPDGQEEKLAVLAETRQMIERKINLFSGKERERLDSLLHYLSTGPIDAEDFPEWVKEQFRDRQGKLGRFVLFRARGSKSDYKVSSDLKEAFWELKFGDKTFPVAAAYFVLPEAVDTIRADGKLTISIGLLAVSLLIFLHFRRPLHALMVVVPTLMGSSTVLGFLYLAGIKLNYFNVVVFPLLLGLGVDNGVHLLQRFKDRGSDSFMHIMRHTGGAMFLTTLTTNIGFAGLFGANHYGLHTLGVTAVAGMTGCLLASLLTLPALLIYRDWLAARRGVLEPSPDPQG